MNFLNYCPHWWREMTAEKDYGKWGPHWGTYTGVKEEICRICGIKRKTQPWRAWKYDLEAAERRVKYLLETEPKDKRPQEKTDA